MNGIKSPSNKNSPHIRRINLASDLDKVADLIEMCFPIQHDPDGQTYIREMRKSAQEMQIFRWISAFDDTVNAKVAGFVWEEDGKIVGNLSLIPFRQKGQQIYLIANVAVHPDRRRNGIAHALTERGLDYLRRKNISKIWLQVRDDNPTAIQLYRSAGFVDRFTRTTWRIQPREFQNPFLSVTNNLKIKRRGNAFWQMQKEWLNTIYPKSMRWNLSVDFTGFEPGIMQSIFNYLDGKKLQHWSVELNGQCKGVITWQKSNSFANNLWLGIDPELEEQLLASTLEVIIKHYPPKHMLSVDYPQGRLQSLFEALRFRQFRTLIWMEHRPG